LWQRHLIEPLAGLESAAVERPDKEANRAYADAHRLDDRARAGVEPSKVHSLELVVPWVVGHLEPGSTIVDIAGGAGTYASRIVRAGSFQVVGLDIAEPLVRARSDDPLLTENVVGDMEELPFEDGRFDAALFVAALHHVPDPLPALREAWRVLRPGGQVFAFEPSSLRARREGTLPIEGDEQEFRLAGGWLVERTRAAGFEVAEVRGRRIAIRALRPLRRTPPLWALRLGDRLDAAARVVPRLERLGEIVLVRARKP
jgi:SAM-dependent methyltransferase